MAFWTEKIVLSGGSGSITIETPTSGTVDDSNTAFGFASLPKIIVSGISPLIQNNGWTWNSLTLTATLTYPVGVGNIIYAIM